jgi:hypothetical protein
MSTALNAAALVAIGCSIYRGTRPQPKLIDWLDEVTADCPKKQAHNMNDPCGARFPDLPRVL